MGKLIIMNKLSIITIPFLIVIFLPSCFNLKQLGKYNTFKDERDNRVYKTVKIEKQIWFAENIAYKVDTGCWANENDLKNVEIYGYLYDYKTANSVCPDGWHLPNENEWETLINNLGGRAIAGKKLKAKTGWEKYNGNGNNKSGFSALPAGQRETASGYFLSLGLSTSFWTNTLTSDSLYAEDCSLDNRSEVFQSGTYIFRGGSVRCIKD